MARRRSVSSHLNTSLQHAPPVRVKVILEEESCDPSASDGLLHDLGELLQVRVGAGEEVSSYVN